MPTTGGHRFPSGPPLPHHYSRVNEAFFFGYYYSYPFALSLPYTLLLHRRKRALTDKHSPYGGVGLGGQGVRWVADPTH